MTRPPARSLTAYLLLTIVLVPLLLAPSTAAARERFKVWSSTKSVQYTPQQIIYAHEDMGFHQVHFEYWRTEQIGMVIIDGIRTKMRFMADDDVPILVTVELNTKTGRIFFDIRPTRGNRWGETEAARAQALRKFLTDKFDHRR